MNIMTKKIAAFTFAALTALGFASCNERKFHVEGAIENAADSILDLLLAQPYQEAP